MRIRILIAALAVALVAMPSALAARGGKPQIAGLQVALRAHGLYHGSIDGIRGPLTVHGVRDFQRSHRLRVTGRVDLPTRLALGALGRPLYGKRLLERGDVGWDVAVLQFLLTRHGISVPINAHFDWRTLRGVRRLQRRLHLRVDGVVGPHTRRALAHRRAPRARHLGIHVVQPGDTLTALALRYGTTVAQLARLNHLDPARYLIVGQRLRVPAAARRTPERTASVARVRMLLDHWARRYGVDRHLVRALAWMESGYNNRLVSSTGARGIMQVEPYTWRFVQAVLIGHPVRHGPDGNIHVGVAYLRHLLRDFHGNRRLALGGWYEGERAVRTRGLYRDTKVFVRDVVALQRRM